MSKRPPSPSILLDSSKKISASLAPNLFVHCTYTELQNAAGSCWTGLLICQKCQVVSSNYGFFEKNDTWLMALQCVNCNDVFKVCTLCSTNRTQFIKQIDVDKHKRLKSHKKRN